MNKKVVVGLSGGVDSSVSALLLKNAGYDVIGLFMRNWDSNLNNDILGNKDLKNNDICPQEQDYNDAVKVAEQIGIKLHRVDFVQEYWDYVFSYFIEQYKSGFTPNPDILCNKYIKFNKFLEKAVELFNCDYIAMGHYAGIEFNSITNQFELHKGIDKNKDQSYFLCQLTQDMLSKSLFPLYKYNKEEVRKIAKDNNLIVANKKDSTGICFIGERDFLKFLENYIPNQPGDIIDIKTNKIIGKHNGVMYYTLGQRKGLNLGGQEQPYYVADKNIEKKIIYVAKTDDSSYLYSDKCYIDNINWILDINKYVKDINRFECCAKFRYRQEDQLVNLIKVGDKYRVDFVKPQRAVTPGQEAVFYINDLCIGGGTILNS